MVLKRIPTIILSAAGLLLAPSFAFADYQTRFSTGRTFDVYTYGSGDFLATIFNGIAMITSGGFIHTLVKISLLLTLLYALLVSMSAFIGSGGTARGSSASDLYRGEGPVTIISIVLTALLTVGIFLSPTATVAITDRVDPSQSQVVDNVPLPSAFIPYAMSTIGDTIGREFETVFSLPDTLQFRNGGVAVGAKYTDVLMNIYPPNASTENLPAAAHIITKSLREYLMKCVFPNYAAGSGPQWGTAGEKTLLLDDLFVTPDLMTHLKSTTYRDPNQFIIAPNDAGSASCADAIDLIDSTWDANYAAWRNDIEVKLSGNVGMSGTSGAGSSMNLGSGALTTDVVSRYFPSSTVSEQTTLKTLALINLLRDSMDSYLAFMGSPSASAFQASQRSTTSGWLTAAKFFNAIIHTVRAVAEGLIYGLSVLLPLFFVFGGIGVLVFYAKMALWLQLWVPIYVIMNLYADHEVQRVIANIFLTETAKGPTLKTVDLIADQLEMTLGYIGSLAPVVPSLAWGLISGSAYSIKAAVSSLGGAGVAATAQSTGAQVMGMGNLSMGNMSVGNDSYGSSTALSSQATYKAGLIKNMADVNTYEKAMPLLGGAGPFVSALGDTGATKTMQDIGRSSGIREGAGNLEEVHNITKAQGRGDIAGTINAADARSNITSEGRYDAIAGNIEASKLFETAKNLGAENYIHEIGGVGRSADAITYGELERGYASLQTYAMGNMAGNDMNTTQGREDFYRGLKSAQGVSMAVTNENVEGINNQIKTMGGKTTLQAGDVATLRGSNNQITSVTAQAGVDRTVKDVVTNDTGTRTTTGDYQKDLQNFHETIRGDHETTFDGRKEVIAGDSIQTFKHFDSTSAGKKTETFDDFRATIGGDHETHFDGRKELITGTSEQHFNNFSQTKGGDTTEQFNNLRTVQGGFRQSEYNFSESKTASMAGGGFKHTYQDPRTGKDIAGDLGKYA